MSPPDSAMIRLRTAIRALRLEDARGCAACAKAGSANDGYAHFDKADAMEAAILQRVRRMLHTATKGKR